MATAIVAAPPSRSRRPPPIRLHEIADVCGIVTETSPRVLTPGLPSAFMTTRRYSPLRAFQSSVAAPLPLLWAVQKDWLAGGLGVGQPLRGLWVILNGATSKSVISSIEAE